MLFKQRTRRCFNIQSINLNIKTSSSAETLKRIDVIRETRDNLLANVNPVSAFESMLVTFRNPQLLSSGS
jgi:hypothetical protein